MTSDNSENHGSIFSVSGPVVVAEHMIGCAMYELVGSPSSDIVENPRY
jgi:V-type H+-transporting ATPase subunit A